MGLVDLIAFVVGIVATVVFLRILRTRKPVRSVVMDADDAIHFYRAGGVITLTEWSKLDPETRRNLSLAGDGVRTDYMIKDTTAKSGLTGLGAVMKPLDGGASFEDALMSEAMQAARKVARR